MTQNLKENEVIKLKPIQIKMIDALQENLYVANNQLTCAHSRKDLKLVAKYSRIAYRCQRALTTYTTEIVKARCEFDKVPMCCHHEINLDTGRIIMHWNCLNQNQETDFTE